MLLWKQGIFLGILLLLPGGMSAQRLPPGLVKLPVANCAWASSAPKNRADKTIALSVSEQWTTHVRFVSSSYQLGFLLHVPEGMEARVSAFAKFDNSQADFTRVCDGIVLTAGAQSLLATAPLGSGSLLWRLEVSVKRSEAGTDLVSLSFDPFELGEDAATWLPGWAHAIGYVCAESSPEPPQFRGQARGFGSRIRLEVDVGAVPGPATDRVKAMVDRAILMAAEVWVNGCAGCRPDHLAVLQIKDRVYARDGILRWLKEHPDGPWTDAQLADFLEPVHRLSTDPQPARGTKRLSAYVPIEEEARKSACARPVEKGALLVEQVIQTICQPDQLDRHWVAKMRVRFRDGATACGDSANIIACRADAELTEYNTRDYTFIGDRGEPVAGHGKVEIDFLHALTHEMGHWIGLPHLDAGHSIMASSMQRSRCIDPSTVAALAHLGQSASHSAYPAAFTLRDVDGPVP